MPKHKMWILIVAVSALFFPMLNIDAEAMSFGRHHNNGSGSPQSGGVSTNNLSSSSSLISIDANPYMTPVPEPSSIVLLGSGIVALGWWRLRRHE